MGSGNVRYFFSNSLKQFKEVPTDKLMVMPYKSAKGLERPVVIVTGVHILPTKKVNSWSKRGWTGGLSM